MNIAIDEFAADTDAIIRCQWIAGRPAEDIRHALGGCGIGLVGHYVQAVGLPLRDSNMQVLWPRAPALLTWSNAHALVPPAPVRAEL